MKMSRCVGIVILATMGYLGPAAAEITLLSRSARVSDTGSAPSSLSSGASVRGSVSGDGRYVVFLSSAPNLVSGQTLAGLNAFLFDRLTGQTRLVSRRPGTAAVAAGGVGLGPMISRDGSCVVFASRATDLVTGQVDTNSSNDVFVHDVASGQTTLVSHVAGQPAVAGGTGFTVLADALAVSHDCRHIAYTSEATNLVPGQIDGPGGFDVFLYDRQTGANILVSHLPGNPSAAANADLFVDLALSGSGGIVAFTSKATNLVAGQADTNDAPDLFLFDPASGSLTLVSHASGAASTAGEGESWSPALSADGSYLAYVSTAGNLVAGHADPAGITFDVFLYERAAGTSLLASRSATSPLTSGNASAQFWQLPALSDDGRYVAFASAATNLVTGQVDSLGSPTTDDDVFLFDRVTGTTTLVSHTGQLSASTTAGNRYSGQVQVSADGGSVTFSSRSPLGYADNAEWSDVFLFRRATGAVELVSRSYDTPNGAALWGANGPAISADGRFVAYSSGSFDIVPFDTNGTTDVFLYDRSASANSLVSRRAADMPSVSGNATSQVSGHLAPQLSADGRYAAFLTRAGSVLPDAVPGLLPLQVVVADRLTGEVRLGSRATAPSCPGCPGDAESFDPALSADGSRVAFTSSASDLVPPPTPSNPWQVFSQHLPAQSMLLVSHAAAGPGERPNAAAEFPVTSADGRTVAFQSQATDLAGGPGPGLLSLYDVFVSAPGAPTRLVSHAAGAPNVPADDHAVNPRISADGRYIAFQSRASNLVSGVADTAARFDAFLYDRETDSSILVSHAAASATLPADDDTEVVALSVDGRFVLILSEATNLVAGQIDSADSLDLFLFDRLTGETLLVTRARGTAATAAGLGSSWGTAALSADGRFSAFYSWGTDLVPGQVDTPNSPDLFLFDRVTGEMTLVSRTAASMVTAAHGLPEVPPQMDAQGRFLAWVSQAVDVVAGQIDPNGGKDVFVFDRQTGTNRLVSRALGTTATAGFGESSWPRISADGRSILFMSTANDLVADDLYIQLSDPFNPPTDVFLDRAPTTPGAFFTLPPCRLADTRIADVPLASGATRTLALHAACGIPSTAVAVSVNVTVVAGGAAGFATLFPGDQPVPETSTLNFRAGQVKANNAVARLALDGSGLLGIVAAFGGSGPVHVILDVNGYFE